VVGGAIGVWSGTMTDPGEVAPLVRPTINLVLRWHTGDTPSMKAVPVCILAESRAAQESSETALMPRDILAIRFVAK
jgi:hypothetical protein